MASDTASDRRLQSALAMRFKVKCMSDEEAKARFEVLKNTYLIGDETEEVLLLAERFGEVGEIWTFDFHTNEWRPGRAQGGEQ